MAATIHRFRAPGWYRAALGMPIGFGFGAGIVTLVRALYGFDPAWDGNSVVTAGA